jgi:hypothetical protein
MYMKQMEQFIQSQFQAISENQCTFRLGTVKTKSAGKYSQEKANKSCDVNR